eukprot:364957-Chlamydomonas_euryale.AAC.8
MRLSHRCQCCLEWTCTVLHDAIASIATVHYTVRAYPRLTYWGERRNVAHAGGQPARRTPEPTSAVIGGPGMWRTISSGPVPRHQACPAAPVPQSPHFLPPSGRPHLSLQAAHQAVTAVAKGLIFEFESMNIHLCWLACAAGKGAGGCDISWAARATGRHGGGDCVPCLRRLVLRIW